MMFSYPYFRSPFYRNYPGYSYSKPSYSLPKSYLYSEVKPTLNEEKTENRKTSPQTDESKEEPDFFEIMGIKLYFDDILLICLLFFLYTEGVEDQSLFIALILLLLS